MGGSFISLMSVSKMPKIVIGGPMSGGPRNPLEALFGGGPSMGGQVMKSGGNQHGPSLELDLGGFLSIDCGNFTKNLCQSHSICIRINKKNV